MRIPHRLAGGGFSLLDEAPAEKSAGASSCPPVARRRYDLWRIAAVPAKAKISMPPYSIIHERRIDAFHTESERPSAVDLPRGWSWMAAPVDQGRRPVPGSGRRQPSIDGGTAARLGV